MSDEDDDISDTYAVPAKTPLATFLSFKQETEKRRASCVHTNTAEKVKLSLDDHKHLNVNGKYGSNEAECVSRSQSFLW